MRYVITLLLLLVAASGAYSNNIGCVEIIAKPSNIVMHWKDNTGVPLRLFTNLFQHNPKLLFAMNGGMYTERYEPLGYYVENGTKYRNVKVVNSDYYNFGKKPQGVFLITKDNVAKIVDVKDPILKTNKIKFATQSAPILIIDGKINPKLTKSKSTATRNGVGILPNGDVLMAVTKDYVTFQQFAAYFKEKGCLTAMFLDGNISQAVTKSPQYKDQIFYGPFIGVVKG